MKVRLYSDTHLDWYEGSTKTWYPPEMPDDKETTLILAGDIWVGTKCVEWDSTSWLGTVASKFKTVLVVLGNHDYWPDNKRAITIRNGGKKLNDMLVAHCIFNVHVLDMSTFEENGVLFIGATLWTDMDKGSPLTMHNMPTHMNYDGKIAYETGPNGQWARFTSERWVREHIKHRDYIKHVAAQNKDKTVVVITHHIPLTTLTDPMYLNSSGNGYYSSDLSNLILDNPNIRYWFYGHTHYSNEYQLGECLLINNCVGYQSEHREQQGFVKHTVLEIK